MDRLTTTDFKIRASLRCSIREDYVARKEADVSSRGIEGTSAYCLIRLMVCFFFFL